ncbi:putative serine-threonine protein kinase, plant-type [Hibiscus syriacus]|uniref:Serine-threonine protein kinase, plant-type n=1 Tax=Hibiscus syriacus TaxID=106335 RepID=A0A6A3D6Q2_HIBSY|nr:putative serine-threonine protein kinase, plant-type [Hibiscus syriacus]
MKFPDDPRLDFTVINSIFDQILPVIHIKSCDKMESDHGKLFIGGISWDTDEERLKEYFSKYGEVVESMIMRNRISGRAHGFGFVVFADPAVAERVIKDKLMIDGRTVEAKKAVPRDDQNIINRNMSGITGSPVPGSMKKIFVGGLASSVTEPRGFGFITYDSEEAVYRVLHKTFHELKGKLVEVKRTVPKELSPAPTRNPVIGYSYVRMDGRFNPLPTGRSGFPPLSTTGYGLGMDMEPGMSPGYGGSSNFGNSLGYGQIIIPCYGGISNRSNTPIGYGVGSGRNDSNLSSATRDIWGNGGLSNATNASGPGSFLGTGRGSFGPLGNSGANWTVPPPVQSGSNASGYTGGTAGYGSADDNYGLGGGGYGRNGGTVAAPTSSFAGPNGYFKGPYGDLYHSGSVYGDSTWQSAAPDLDGPSSFSYGLGNASSDVTARSSDDYVGSYSVTSRQSNRGNVLFCSPKFNNLNLIHVIGQNHWMKVFYIQLFELGSEYFIYADMPRLDK